MKRMKRLISTFACALAVLIWTCAPVPIMEVRGATTVDSVVYPTGRWPIDVLNVRNAVKGGGTVLLKATNTAGQPTAFNFGTPEEAHSPLNAVELTTDVNIVGERVGSNMTTIQGGLGPIRSRVPVKSRIQGIDFEGPLGHAIQISASTGSDIIGNRINSVVPLPLSVGFSESDGIDVSGNDDPSAITGTIRIADNVIENLPGDFANAVQCDEVAADIEITGNTINIGEGHHRIQGWGILVIRSHSSVLIDQNLLGPDMADEGIVIWGDADAVYHVSRNTVICENPFADGISAVGGLFTEGTVRPVIEKNHVTMHNSLFGGISLYDLVTGAYVGENKIEGDGAFALQVNEVFGDPANIASANRFEGNDIADFTSSVADVYFGTNTQDNVYVGDCSSVIDLGVNNHITCATPSSGNPMGEQMRSAHARKREALQRLTSVDRRSASMTDW
jgi:hypothetical protein